MNNIESHRALHNIEPYVELTSEEPSSAVRRISFIERRRSKHEVTNHAVTKTHLRSLIETPIFQANEAESLIIQANKPPKYKDVTIEGKF